MQFPAGEDFCGSSQHPRLLSVPLLSGLCCAGVFAGLDSRATNLEPGDPPAERGGFFSAFQAPVAKWLTRRSAKPVFVGSKPTRCSKIQSNKKGPQPLSARLRPF